MNLRANLRDVLRVQERSRGEDAMSRTLSCGNPVRNSRINRDYVFNVSLVPKTCPE